jgi:two-component system, chemotaxis family, protein-glutamate methylesterase/glutaminase
MTGLDRLLAARPFEAVAIGASAGGIDALFTVLGALPADMKVPIVAVLHLSPEHESRLAEIFGARLALRVREAESGMPLEPGTLYFAPPDYHLLVEPDLRLSLSCEPPVHFSRPSIDVLFESCAETWGDKLVAVVLTGANDDGARGLARVRESGGLAVVQDPAEATQPAMPSAAIALAGADCVLSLPEIGTLLHTVLSP